MELKDFIKLSINEIMDGIEETIKERKEKNKAGHINPKIFSEDEMEIDTIKFDLSVNVSKKGSGDIGLSIPFSKISGKGAIEKTDTSIQRIEFTLGISWPYTRIEDAKKLKRA